MNPFALMAVLLGASQGSNRSVIEHPFAPPDISPRPRPVNLPKPARTHRKRKNVLRGICGWRRDAHAPASGSHYLQKL